MRRRCAETMRSWRTRSTLGCAARRRGLGWGLGCGDAEVLVAPGKMGTGRGDAGFGVAGDGGVAIEDEVVVGSDAGGVDLGAGEAGEEEHQYGSAVADGV